MASRKHAGIGGMSVLPVQRERHAPYRGDIAAETPFAERAARCDQSGESRILGGARPLYLGFATIGLVIPYPALGDPIWGLAGALVVIAAGFYLFKVRAVAEYLAKQAHTDICG